MAEDEYRILGRNARCYPSQSSPTGFVRITVVLVGGEGKDDYAAYQGEGDDQWVAARGDRMRFEEALIHFPIGLDRGSYRHD